MCSPLVGGNILITYVIISLLPALLFGAVEVLFKPGERNSFDFIENNPEILEDSSYKELCSKGGCHFSVIFNYTLVVSNSSRFEVLTVNQAGPYILKASNGDFGLALTKIINVKPAFLCLLSINDYLTRPIQTQFYRGRTAVVVCPVIGEPLPIITWKKYNRSTGTFDTIRPTDRLIITKLGHLFIIKFNDSDATTYFCTAKNSCGRRCDSEPICSGFSIESKHVKISILDEVPYTGARSQFYFLNPKYSINCWLDRPSDCYFYTDYFNRLMMFVPFNGTVNIETYVDYSKDYAGATMDSLKFSPRFKNYNKKVCFGELLYYNYKDQDNNDFTCVTYMKDHTYGEKAMYTFAITEPPTVTAVSANHVDHKIHPIVFGTNHTIAFKVQIKHKTDLHLEVDVADFKCFKDGDDVGMKVGWHTQCSYNITSDVITVSINCATPSDSGYYQVTLWSPYGSRVSDSMYLEVADELPSSKVNCYSLEHQTVSSTEVSLSWHKPQTNEDILHYLIIVDNLVWNHKITVLTTMTTKIVGNLHPGTVYVAEVFSRGQLVGRKVKVKTYDAVPTAPPSKVDCVPHAASIKCSWHTISKRERNGVIIGYQIRHNTKRHGSHWDKEKQLNATTAIISNLKPITNYTVEIAGCTSAGCGPYIQTSAMTSEDFPSFPPMFRYITSSSHSIKMGWAAAHGTFRHLFYKITCNYIERDRIVFERNTTDLDVVIHGNDILSSSTFYKVTVSAGSSIGIGPPLEKIIETKSSSSRMTFSVLIFYVILLRL